MPQLAGSREALNQRQRLIADLIVTMRKLNHAHQYALPVCLIKHHLTPERLKVKHDPTPEHLHSFDPMPWHLD
jgi:hypothetical protein